MREIQHFNLLPWRKKVLGIKIFQHIIWHMLVILICLGTMNVINYYLNRFLSSTRAQLEKLNVQLNAAKIRDVKQEANENFYRQHQEIQRTILKNRQNKKLMRLILNAVSSSLTSQMFIISLSIEHSLLILTGMVLTESDLLSFIKMLKENLMFKAINLYKMEKSVDDKNIIFEVHGELNNSLS